MIICICQNVSERDIARAVASGCRSFAELQDDLAVGTACGTCLCSARASFAEQKSACCVSRHSSAALMPMSASA